MKKETLANSLTKNTLSMSAIYANKIGEILEKELPEQSITERRKSFLEA